MSNMKITALEIPDGHIQFARAIESAAKLYGIEKFETTYKSDFDSRLKLDRRLNGVLIITYNAVDERGRPNRQLSITSETKLIVPIEYLPDEV